MSTHKMLLIPTGGTIAGQIAEDKRNEQGIDIEGSFSELVKPTLEALEDYWKLDIEIDSFGISDDDGKEVNVDSSNIVPKHWTALASLIKEKFDEYNSFIITHGTNTLGYTAAALTFAIANSNKPIILTGSQVPYGRPGTDALVNLSNAIRVAVWPREGEKLRGVMAVFGSHIITGSRVKKDTEFDYDAFKSFSSGSIGRIGRIIHVNETNLKNHLKYLSTNEYMEAKKAEDLRCESDFDTNIVSLTEFPGMSPDIFETLVERNDVRGFILRAFGAGDASSNLIPAFEFLKKREIPIVVTTQAPNGNSNFQVNDPGLELKKRELAIPAYDMSIESQTTKLAWLLAKQKKHEITFKQLCKEMIKDIRGEINVMWEVGN